MMQLNNTRKSKMNSEYHTVKIRTISKWVRNQFANNILI